MKTASRSFSIRKCLFSFTFCESWIFRKFETFFMKQTLLNPPRNEVFTFFFKYSFHCVAIVFGNVLCHVQTFNTTTIQNKELIAQQLLNIN